MTSDASCSPRAARSPGRRQSPLSSSAAGDMGGHGSRNRRTDPAAPADRGGRPGRVPAPGGAPQPSAERLHLSRLGAGRALRGPHRRRTRPGRRSRTAGRGPVRGQGHRELRRDAYDSRLTGVQERAAREEGRSRHRAPAPGRGRPGRQDGDPGVRSRLHYRLASLRGYPQSLGPVQDARREQRRLGRGGPAPLWFRSPPAPTTAGQCGARRRSAAWSGSSRRSD